MEVVAKARGIPISARKVRLVVDTVRGKNVPDAVATLRFLPQRSAPDVLKVLRSAMANAENNYDLEPSEMFVKSIFVDEGPTMKRWRPRARGRVNQELHRTSHITVILDEKEA